MAKGKAEKNLAKLKCIEKVANLNIKIKKKHIKKVL